MSASELSHFTLHQSDDKRLIFGVGFRGPDKMSFMSDSVVVKLLRKVLFKLLVIAFAVLVVWYGFSLLRSQTLDRNSYRKFNMEDSIVATYLREQAAFAKQNGTIKDSDADHVHVIKSDLFKRVLKDQPETDDQNRVNALILFTKAKGNQRLINRFKVCVSSMLQHTSLPISFHLVCDEQSEIIALESFIELSKTEYGKLIFDIKPHSVSNMADQLHGLVSHLQAHFSYKPGAYYSDALFFLSVALHRLLNLSKIIMLDSDLKFRGDIAQLYSLFNEFDEKQVIGMANEMQPVYRHSFSAYRNRHKGTRVGEPPPNGLPGFNSGVVLLHLDHMRRSVEYNSLLNKTVISALAEKYMFRGHLGDQDFFTLIGLEHEELFFVVPCKWNYQLCTWWRDHGYESVFYLYSKCEDEIMVYHGNCGMSIPD